MPSSATPLRLGSTFSTVRRIHLVIRRLPYQVAANPRFPSGSAQCSPGCRKHARRPLFAGSVPIPDEFLGWRSDKPRDVPHHRLVCLPLEVVDQGAEESKMTARSGWLACLRSWPGRARCRGRVSNPPARPSRYVHLVFKTGDVETGSPRPCTNGTPASSRQSSGRV